MDTKDKKILFELDLDARATFSQISKKTKMSQETIRYRIKNLIENGTIEKFLSIFNTALLGYSYYQLFLKFQNINQEKKQEIIDFLKKDGKVAWIGNIEGTYDLSFIIYVKNQLELQKFINVFDEKYNKNIMKRTLSINVQGEFLKRDYLLDRKREIGLKSSYEYSNKTISLDDFDSKLCYFLSENARISAVDLASKLKCSADKILQRLKKLKKEKVLVGSSLILNQTKLNQMHYKILLFLNNFSKEKEKRLIEYIKSKNRTIAVIKTLSEWNLEIDIEIDDFLQLENFTMELTSNFSEIIKDYDLLRIKEMPKYTFFPQEFKN